MAKNKDFDADGILNDIDNFMFSAFDALIKVSVKRLGTEEAALFILVILRLAGRLVIPSLVESHQTKVSTTGRGQSLGE